MFKALRKKNSEYSVKERWITSVITFFIFAIFSYWVIRNAELFQSLRLLPYVGGTFIGLAFGLVGYIYPKVIHVTIFALPLMFLGG